MLLEQGKMTGQTELRSRYRVVRIETDPVLRTEDGVPITIEFAVPTDPRYRLTLEQVESDENGRKQVDRKFRRTPPFLDFVVIPGLGHAYHYGGLVLDAAVKGVQGLGKLLRGKEGSLIV